MATTAQFAVAGRPDLEVEVKPRLGMKPNLNGSGQVGMSSATMARRMGRRLRNVGGTITAVLVKLTSGMYALMRPSVALDPEKPVEGDIMGYVVVL